MGLFLFSTPDRNDRYLPRFAANALPIALPFSWDTI
jgi:hypothetical protein